MNLILTKSFICQIDLKNNKKLNPKNRTAIFSNLYMFFCLLLYNNAANSADQNASALSLKSTSNCFYSKTSDITSSNEIDEAKNQREKMHYGICFNLLMQRTTIFLSRFLSTLKAPKLIPSIMIRNKSDMKLEKIKLDNYIVISEYLQNFISDKYFIKFCKTGDLSYFDGFKREISISTKTEILFAYLEKIKYIGKVFNGYDEITIMFNEAYEEIKNHIELRQKSVLDLQICLKNFFSQLMNANMKYNKAEITLDEFKEEYNSAATDLFIKFECCQIVFKLKILDVNDYLWRFIIKLHQYIKNCNITRLNYKIGDFEVGWKYYCWLSFDKSNDFMFLHFKKMQKLFLKLLDNKKTYQENFINEINNYKIWIKKISSAIKKEKAYLDNIYADEGLSKLEKSFFNSFKREIKIMEVENAIDYINVILDGFNVFFIFKIYAKSARDIFICLVRDKIGDSTLNRREDFVDILTCNYRTESISDGSKNMIESTRKRLVETESINPKITELTELVAILDGFFENQLDAETLETIKKLDEIHEKLTKKVLNLEKLIVECYYKILRQDYNNNIGNTANECLKKDLEKNYLFKLFLKEYIKRQHILAEKYVEFYKLDKDKYVVNEEFLLPFTNLGFELKDLLIEINKS